MLLIFFQTVENKAIKQNLTTFFTIIYLFHISVIRFKIVMFFLKVKNLTQNS